jgi:hypothetical protein
MMTRKSARGSSLQRQCPLALADGPDSVGAGRVDDGKGAGAGCAVAACRARDRADIGRRLILADQAIEEGRFADVRRPDNGDVMPIAEGHLYLFLGGSEQLAQFARIARQHRQERQ